MFIENMIWLGIFIVLIIPAVVFLLILILNIVLFIKKKKRKQKKILKNIIIIIIASILLCTNVWAITYFYSEKNDKKGFSAIDARHIADGITINGSTKSPLVEVSSDDNWENGYSSVWYFTYSNYYCKIFENGSYIVEYMENTSVYRPPINNWTIDSDEAYENMIQEHEKGYYSIQSIDQMTLFYSPSDNIPIWKGSFNIAFGSATYYVDAQTGDLISQ